MKLLIGIVLAISGYVFVGTALALVTQAFWPDALPLDGHPPVERAALLADLFVHCIACAAAGALAMAPSGQQLRFALLVVGGLLFAITLVTTLATGSGMPQGYDVAVIVLTLPSFALGSAWCQAMRGPGVVTNADPS